MKGFINLNGNTICYIVLGSNYGRRYAVHKYSVFYNLDYYFLQDYLFIKKDLSTADEVRKYVHDNYDAILNEYKEYKKFRESVERPYFFYTDELVTIAGKKYTMRVVSSDTDFVELTDTELILNVTDKYSLEHCRKVYEDWKSTKLLEIIESFKPEVYPKLNRKRGLRPEVIETFNRRTSNRNSWGFCREEFLRERLEGSLINAFKAYKITLGFNIDLLELPLESIKTVFVHECAHIEFPDHTKEFYEFMTTIYPEWVEWDRYVNEFPI